MLIGKATGPHSQLLPALTEPISRVVPDAAMTAEIGWQVVRAALFISPIFALSRGSHKGKDLMAYRVQVLHNNQWQFITYPNSTSWDIAVEQFTFYMNTWTNKDYRIVEVSR